MCTKENKIIDLQSKKHRNFQSQTICILLSIAFIQVVAGNRFSTPELSSFQSVPAVTTLMLPSLQAFVESKFSYRRGKVHCKATEGNKNYRNDRRD